MIFHQYNGVTIFKERLAKPILVGITPREGESYNRYSRDVYRLIFPNFTWTRCGNLIGAKEYTHIGSSQGQRDASRNYSKFEAALQNQYIRLRFNLDVH